MELNEVELEQTRIRREDAEYRKRMCFLAHEVFVNNENGRELISCLTKKLYQEVGPDNNATYYAGQQDMLRSILGLIEDYKRQGHTK